MDENLANTNFDVFPEKKCVEIIKYLGFGISLYKSIFFLVRWIIVVILALYEVTSNIEKRIQDIIWYSHT